jgi:hypothetical protein
VRHVGVREQVLPSVRRHISCDHVDEGAFSGAVFAEKDVNFAWMKIEVHVLERDRAREALPHAGEPKEIHAVGHEEAIVAFYLVSKTGCQSAGA